jgi:hypothetical protein
MNADHVYTHHDDGGGQDDVGENDEGLDVEELMRNVAPNVFLQCRNKGFDNFQTLNKASRDLYEGCKGCHKEHTVLWMTLELLKLKSSNGWPDSSFSAFLELLSKVLRKPNDLLTSTYLAKKIIGPLTLGVEKFMLARTFASYTKKNMNSKISVQGAMLVSTTGMTTLRKIPTIIRGKDKRGRTPLLQINTIKGLKREKFLPLWCGTYLSLTVWSVCSLMIGKLNSCFRMSNGRGMERSDILLMVGSGNILTLAMRRTFLMMEGILDLVLAPMEWILLEGWGTHTVPG